MLTLAAGGWVLLTAGGLCVAVFIWWLAGALPRLHAPRGDGIDVATYGFDLSTCLVSRAHISAGGRPRDTLPVLTDPPVLTPRELATLAEELRRGHQGKFLVPSDLVVGVELNGVARAYPLRLLRWHQIVNDTLGGVPITVTFTPLSDSLVVFERRVTETVVEFGDSGLVYGAAPLLYDRQPAAEAESLWSPLQLRALTGPAAAEGMRLRPLPAALMPWREWQVRHPQATVLAPQPALWRLYKESPDWERLAERLADTVRPAPPADGPAPLAQMLIVPVGETWHAWALAELVANGAASGETQIRAADMSLRVRVSQHPATAWVESADPLLPVLYSRWFAWYAQHPQTRVEVLARD